LILFRKQAMGCSPHFRYHAGPCSYGIGIVNFRPEVSPPLLIGMSGSHMPVSAQTVRLVHHILNRRN
jgi:hypothetical protein